MDKYLSELFKALSSQNPKEMGHLLRDLLTPMEERMFAKRVQIAKMLLTGRKYHEIEKALNVQRSTIARIRSKLLLSTTKTLEKTVARLPHH
ncbi:MAG: hypothetical protein BMS9Abin34_436 [Patescibacteria group bacterium]|nr:MAG: hypothetical protein BMS9Abin34_436 [Patescibacteria group bacterium]